MITVKCAIVDDSAFFYGYAGWAVDAIGLRLEDEIEVHRMEILMTGGIYDWNTWALDGTPTAATRTADRTNMTAETVRYYHLGGGYRNRDHVNLSFFVITSNSGYSGVYLYDICKSTNIQCLDIRSNVLRFSASGYDGLFDTTASSAALTIEDSVIVNNSMANNRHFHGGGKFTFSGCYFDTDGESERTCMRPTMACLNTCIHPSGPLQDKIILTTSEEKE
jgi:hypothetical protein